MKWGRESAPCLNILTGRKGVKGVCRGCCHHFEGLLWGANHVVLSLMVQLWPVLKCTRLAQSQLEVRRSLHGMRTRDGQSWALF